MSGALTITMTLTMYIQVLPSPLSTTLMVVNKEINLGQGHLPTSPPLNSYGAIEKVTKQNGSEDSSIPALQLTHGHLN